MTGEVLEVGLFVSAFVITLLCIVYIADKFMYLDVTKLRWKRARKNFPNVAAQLGLEYRLPKFNYQIGEIKGKYKGHQVSVRPDDQAYIEVAQIGYSRFDSSHIELSTSVSQLISPPKGMIQFDSGNSGFDRFFNTRYAVEDVAKILTNNATKVVYIGQFSKKWKDKISYLQVGTYGVRCSLKYRVSSYIPTQLLEKILPDLCEMAKLFESLVEPENDRAYPPSD